MNESRNRNCRLPLFDTLEFRLPLASVAGVDYVLEGQSWDSHRITYSVPPGGSNWYFSPYENHPNDLPAQLTAGYGGDGWRREIARSLQTWAASANIDLIPVADSNAPENAPGLPQGDPNFGDIRFGGRVREGDLNELAEAASPPYNGQTLAGDVSVNTNFHFAPGSGYDFYSVLLHESGHSLGLSHSQNSAAVMAPLYGGVRSGLTQFDVDGIQAIYGPRMPDRYQVNGAGTSFATAIDLTPGLNISGGASATGVSLARIGDTEYFSIVAPPGSDGTTFKPAALASGISSFSPKISVFDEALYLLGSSSLPDQWSDNVGISLSGIQAGHRYFMAVTGATSDVFAVGSYTLGLAFAGFKPPIVAIPKDRFEPNATIPQMINLGRRDSATISGLTIDSPSDIDLFAFESMTGGATAIDAGSSAILVVDSHGLVVSNWSGSGRFVARVGQRYSIVITAMNRMTSSYSLSISTR